MLPDVPANCTLPWNKTSISTGFQAKQAFHFLCGNCLFFAIEICYFSCSYPFKLEHSRFNILNQPLGDTLWDNTWVTWHPISPYRLRVILQFWAKMGCVGSRSWGGGGMRRGSCIFEIIAAKYVQPWQSCSLIITTTNPHPIKKAV